MKSRLTGSSHFGVWGVLLAGLGRTHALTSQRLGLLQLHDNLLRRVLRELPHGHPFCPATSSRDYSEQPSQDKRSEKPRPLHLLRRVLQDLPHGRPFARPQAAGTTQNNPLTTNGPKKPRPLHEHSSKREDLDPNYTLNYEEPTNPQQRAHRPRAGPYASARTHSWPTSILTEQATAPQKPSTESSNWADAPPEATAPPPTTNYQLRMLLIAGGLDASTHTQLGRTSNVLDVRAPQGDRGPIVTRTERPEGYIV